MEIAVKVQPRSRRPGLHGRRTTSDAGPAGRGNGVRLAIGGSEPAEGCRGNRAACAALALALDVPASAVSVAAGAASREKILRIAGDPELLAPRLAAL